MLADEVADDLADEVAGELPGGAPELPAWFTAWPAAWLTAGGAPEPSAEPEAMQRLMQCLVRASHAATKMRDQFPGGPGRPLAADQLGLNIQRILTRNRRTNVPAPLPRERAKSRRSNPR